ncbi:aldehyde dehydrogenase family protein [Clostridiales bacterium COT073_COT-073]|nr:aldehyde dehydrogenase family protein [Clostridiales bacterium COT073_COT-073]
MNFIDKDLSSVQEARILSENAGATQRLLFAYETKFFDKAFDSVYHYIDRNLHELSKMFVEESGYGNYEDTYKISKLFLDALYNKVCGENVIGEFEGGSKIGVPMGGIILIPSPKNTLLFMINTVLLAIKTGNVLIIVTEKRVQKLTQKFVEIVREALQAEDYPQDFVSCFKESCSEGIKEIVKSKKLAVIINAGNKEYLSECLLAGKVFYYGSTGASPVFIERTADIKPAIKDIVYSRKFNHGILPGAEQFLVVDEPVINEVNRELKKNSCYFMTPEDEKKLLNVLIHKDKMDEEKIGKSAYKLALEAGFEVPVETTLLVSYQEYISEVNSYTKELNVPVLVVYKEADWLHACEKCIKILTTEHDGHSLSIYSKDPEVIRQFAIKKPVGRVMVNTNTSFSAMGIGTHIYPSAILGAFTRGIGVLSSNLTPDHLVYVRDVVRGKENETYGGSKESDEYMVDDFLALLAKIIEK